MRKHLAHLLRLAPLFLVAVILVAQTEHMTAFTGTWKLNVAQSQFGSEPPPQSISVTFAPDGTFTLEVVDEKGEPHQWSHPWSGDAEVAINGHKDETILSKYRGHILDETVKKGGKAVETVHSVLSSDGKIMTTTIDATDPQGRPVHHVLIFEKQ
jgi:hypothetical protein